ncbi:MAG: hypothetical protein NT029_22345 [Armatimonadetes bacterium]|nr:hypothetical protein [Armatimonadota bacterium]
MRRQSVQLMLVVGLMCAAAPFTVAQSRRGQSEGGGSGRGQENSRGSDRGQKTDTAPDRGSKTDTAPDRGGKTDVAPDRGRTTDVTPDRGRQTDVTRDRTDRTRDDQRQRDNTRVDRTPRVDGGPSRTSQGTGSGRDRIGQDRTNQTGGTDRDAYRAARDRRDDFLRNANQGRDRGDQGNRDTGRGRDTGSVGNDRNRGDQGGRDTTDGSVRGTRTDVGPGRTVDPIGGGRDRGQTDRQDRTNGRLGGPTQVRTDRGGNTGRDGYRGARETNIRPNRYIDQNRGRAEADRNRARDLFTRSNEGRRYDHGINLRPASRTTINFFFGFFPDHYHYYPYYCPTFVQSDVFFSPFHYYYGFCPPWIYRRHVIYGAPRVIYVESPIYVGDECRGWDDEDEYYLTRNSWANLREADADGLRYAADDIEDCFRNADINLLAGLTDPDVRIAIYQRGRYQYSLAADDYLDLTRDAIRNIDTVAFDLTRVRRRGNGVYTLSGIHVYRDKGGDRRKVFVSMAVERVQGRWTLTQVDTAPDRLER